MLLQEQLFVFSLKLFVFSFQQPAVVKEIEQHQNYPQKEYNSYNEELLLRNSLFAQLVVYFQSPDLQVFFLGLELSEQFVVFIGLYGFFASCKKGEYSIQCVVSIAVITFLFISLVESAIVVKTVRGVSTNSAIHCNCLARVVDSRIILFVLQKGTRHIEKQLRGKITALFRHLKTLLHYRQRLCVFACKFVVFGFKLMQAIEGFGLVQFFG